MKTVTLNFYSTPSHGYLQVHKNLVNEIAVEATNSPYSFYNAKTGLFYFEEDCDASEVVTALRNLGYEINYAENHYDEYEIIKTYKRLG
jgi:hypothetical protein